MLGAAAAAGAVGYMLGHSNTPTAPAHAPAAGTNSNLAQTGPAAVQDETDYSGKTGTNDESATSTLPPFTDENSQQNSSGNGGFGIGLLALLALGGLGYFGYRRYAAKALSKRDASSGRSIPWSSAATTNKSSFHIGER
jgi:hypothetical protein